MKKTYITPALIAVQLGTTHMMAESFRINRDGTNTIQNSNDILVKEERGSDTNLWDEEW